MDKTPSLARALVGLTLLIAVIVGGYLALKSASDNQNEARSEEPRLDEILFVRSGGFTGRTTTLLLREDGRARLVKEPIGDEKTGRVNVAHRNLDRVFAVMDSGWPDQDEINSGGGGCADCPQYDITYQGTHVQVFFPVPPRFEEIIRMLNRLTDRL